MITTHLLKEGDTFKIPQADSISIGKSTPNHYVKYHKMGEEEKYYAIFYPVGRVLVVTGEAHIIFEKNG